MSKPQEPQRIAKLLARAGIASRREIERMIADRRIALNGVPLETPATLLATLNGVTVDGQPVAAPAPARLFRFHKPAGVLTAERDFTGRRTIYDILPREMPRVIPVGRLDLNTEGLLLLTTDGELKRQLELPATKVKRTYRARAFGDVTQAQLEDLIEGVEIDGVRYGSIDANLERRTGANVWVEMTLTEGKNREVRRVLEHLGLRVSRLIRTSYGPIPLADMPVGAVDEVRQHDLIQFRRDLRLPVDKRSNAPLATKSRPTPRAESDVDADAQDTGKVRDRGQSTRGSGAVRPPRPATAASARADAPRYAVAARSNEQRGAAPSARAKDRPDSQRTTGKPLRRDGTATRDTDRKPRSGAPGYGLADKLSGQRRTAISGDGAREDAPRPSKKPIRRREEPEVLETNRKRLVARPPRSDGPARPPRGPRTGSGPRKPGPPTKKGPR